MLPYDVQLALESEAPELRGIAFVITKEGLASGTLRLLLGASDGATAGLLAEAESRLSRRFEVQVEISEVSDLPLRFKGVPPILSEREVAAAI
jgi:hypothetical protein